MGFRSQTSLSTSSYKSCKGANLVCQSPTAPPQRVLGQKSAVLGGGGISAPLLNLLPLSAKMEESLPPSSTSSPLPPHTRTHGHTDSQTCASPPAGVVEKRLTEKRYTSRPETFTSGRSTCKVGTWQVSGNLHIPKTGKSRMLFGRQRFSPSLNQKDCSIILFGQLPVEAPQNH